MALSKIINYKGISVAGAYIRVSSVVINHGGGVVEFLVNSMSAPDEIPFDSISMQCPYDLEGVNPFKQVYEHLKTLEQFAEAEDF